MCAYHFSYLCHICTHAGVYHSAEDLRVVLEKEMRRVEGELRDQARRDLKVCTSSFSHEPKLTLDIADSLRTRPNGTTPTRYIRCRRRPLPPQWPFVSRTGPTIVLEELPPAPLRSSTIPLSPVHDSSSQLRA
jgi:hypothetical protein